MCDNIIRFENERPSKSDIENVMSVCNGESFWIVTNRTNTDNNVEMIHIKFLSKDSYGWMGLGDTGFCQPIGVNRVGETWTAIGLDGLPLRKSQ